MAMNLVLQNKKWEGDMISRPPAKVENSIIEMWALDLFRALSQRPLWCKVLLRGVMGKYAYREFIGMRDALNVYHYPWDDYLLEGCEYQKDSVPTRWWIDGRET